MSAMKTLSFTVNGAATQVEVEDHEYLAEVLRNRLGLTCATGSA